MVIITDYTVIYNEENIFLVESSEISICPICGHPLKPRDHVKRIMKDKDGEVKRLCIRRLIYTNESCRRLNRELIYWLHISISS